MTWSVQDLELAAAKRNSVLVVIPKVLPAQIACARTVNAELCAGALLKRQRPATVIDMDMRQKDLFDFFCAHGFGLLDDAIHVSVLAQRQIDDTLAVLTNDLLVSALQSHHAWVIRGKICDVSWLIHYRPFNGVAISTEQSHRVEEKRQTRSN